MKELRLGGISTIEAANAFLPAFVQTYNTRFARPPARDQDLHRPIAGRNDLDDILCWREQRSVSRQLCHPVDGGAAGFAFSSKTI